MEEFAMLMMIVFAVAFLVVLPFSEKPKPERKLECSGSGFKGIEAACYLQELDFDN